MVIDRRFVRHGHLHRFVVVVEEDGWDVFEVEDALIVRHVHRNDWHRVERDRWLFELTATPRTIEESAAVKI